MKRFKKIVFIVCTFAFIAHNQTMHANLIHNDIKEFVYTAVDQSQKQGRKIAPRIFAQEIMNLIRQDKNLEKLFNEPDAPTIEKFITAIGLLGNLRTSSPQRTKQEVINLTLRRSAYENKADLEEAWEKIMRNNANISGPSQQYTSQGSKEYDKEEEASPSPKTQTSDTLYDALEKFMEQNRNLDPLTVISHLQNTAPDIYNAHQGWWQVLGTEATIFHNAKIQGSSFDTTIEGLKKRLQDFGQFNREQQNNLINYLRDIWAKTPNPISIQPQHSITWGISERMGRRPTMEDAYTMNEWTDNQGRKHYFFGIYDGHGGTEVAQTLASGSGSIQPLHDRIKNLTNFNKQDYEHAFNAMQTDIKRLPKGPGSTAVIAHIYTEKDSNNMNIAIAHVGDSRAIIIDQDNTITFATTDHSPKDSVPVFNTTSQSENSRVNYNEPKRVIDAGGAIATHSPNGRFFGFRVAYGTPGKKGNLVTAQGGLAMTRSFETEQDQYKGIIATPDVYIGKISPNNTIILACDGVFEEMGYKDAASTVSNGMQNFKELPGETAMDTFRGNQRYPSNSMAGFQAGNSDKAIYAARALRDAAFKNGSSDNISAMVININSIP